MNFGEGQSFPCGNERRPLVIAMLLRWPKPLLLAGTGGHEGG
jgi:hypothetical protein